MNIIYDISHAKLNDYMRNMVNQQFQNVQEIDYQQILEAHYIFKSISSSKDVQSLKKYSFSHHTLIAIIQSSQFMFELLEYYPLCYIRISHLESDLKKCLSFIQNVYCKEGTLMTFRVNYSYIQLQSSNISYIESFGHYLIVYTQSGEYQVRDKLSRVKEILKQYSFVQVHRSYLVNKNYVQKVNQQGIVLTNSIIIPVGKKYKSIVSTIMQ